MKTTSKWIIGAIITGCIVFALSPGPLHFIHSPTNWELREQLVFLTGACAMSLMVLSMIISVRYESINRIFGGLDKGYLVHKWTGIYATICIILHWLIENVPHGLVEFNVIANPGELVDGSQFSEVEIALFQSGVVIAEVLFYLVLLLVAIALFNKMPYRYFRLTHKLFPGVFLLLAYHAATAQLKEHWLDSPAGYLLLLLLSIGSMAAIIGLFQQIGKSRKVSAVITALDYHEQHIVDVHLAVKGKSFIHQAGQYAFFQFEHDKEPHPFTIASSANDPKAMRIAIKGLGDFTKGLSNYLEVGQTVQLEGPYGEFKFEDSCERQIWIAGGIGITPFMARLDALSRYAGTSKRIDFWYCTRGELHHQFPSNLQYQCEKNGVHLHHLNSTKKEYLTMASLQAAVGNFDKVSIWFCGPPEFRVCLQKQLKLQGVDSRQFHYDDFNMR